MYPPLSGRMMQAFSHPSIDLAALEDHLSDAEIETVAAQIGHTWRSRDLPPGLTVRSIIYRGLHHDKAIDAVLADLAASAPWAKPPTASAWCQARQRLPEAVLTTLLERSAQRVRRRFGQEFLTWGRPVFRFDGTTVSMPDAPALAEHFGYANTKHGQGRFPSARVAVCVAAGTEVICAARMDPYRTSERTQFRHMWDNLPKGSIYVADRYFSDFYDLAKLRQRGIHMVSRLFSRRDPVKLIAAGKKIGPHEWRVPLELSRQQRDTHNDPSLPDRLWVRLVRHQFRHQGKRHTLWLVTTLMDPSRYGRSAIIDLYRDRWTIETRIGTLKTYLDAVVLRSTTVDGVRKELLSRMLAYNLVWTVIHQAAEQEGVPADRISFADTVKAILAFSIPLRGTHGLLRQQLYCRLLTFVAEHRNPYRPGRVEPRLVKREKRRYGFLKEPRAQARRRA